MSEFLPVVQTILCEDNFWYKNGKKEKRKTCEESKKNTAATQKFSAYYASLK